MNLGMDTTSILKRIIELKKVSVQLKQSTEHLEHNNNTIIKGILDVGKSITPMSTMRKAELSQFITPPRLTQRSVRNAKNTEMGQDQNLSVLNRTSKIKNNKQLSQSQYVLQSSFITNKIEQQTMSPAQQINHLRHENNELELQIQELKQKLKKLQQIQKQQKEQQWRTGLPYFILNIPKIKIFYTKLTIAEKDYDKIDYTQYSVELGLEKITLDQLSQPGLSSRPPKSIVLMLSELKQVSYISKKVITGVTYQTRMKDQQQDKSLIVYSFRYHKNKQGKGKQKSNVKKSALSLLKGADRIKQDEDSEIIQTLFMKFDNEQLLKQWDLAVFVNYKIVQQVSKSDLNQEGVFSKSNQSQNRNSSQKKTQKNRSESNSKSKSNQKIPFDKLLQKFQNKNSIQQYIKQTQSQQSKMKSQKSIKKQQKVQNIEKGNNNNILKKLTSNTQQMQVFVNPRSNNNNIKIRDELQSPTRINQPDRESIQVIVNKQRSDTSHFGTASVGLTPEQKAKQMQQQRIRGEQVRRQKIMQLQEQKRKQIQRLQALKKTQFQLSIKRAKQSLRRGYNMIKYARYALNPHQKRVYLNQDGRRLCWQDIKSTGQPKWITINQIDRINQGQIGKAIQAHAKQQEKINQKGCFVVIHLKSQDRKALQLKSPDQFAMEQFCKQLQLYRGSLIKK